MWVLGVLRSHHSKYSNAHRRENGTEVRSAEMYQCQTSAGAVLHKQLLRSRTFPFFGCVFSVACFTWNCNRSLQTGSTRLKKKQINYEPSRVSQSSTTCVFQAHTAAGLRRRRSLCSHRAASELRGSGALPRGTAPGRCGERCAQPRGAALGPRADGAARELRRSP